MPNQYENDPRRSNKANQRDDIGAWILAALTALTLTILRLSGIW